VVVVVVVLVLVLFFLFGLLLVTRYLDEGSLGVGTGIFFVDGLWISAESRL
jgi:hypothetical protein